MSRTHLAAAPLATVVHDADGYKVIAADGAVVAVFTQGSDDTQKRHANAFAADQFVREGYEDDLREDYNWTGQHVLTSLPRRQLSADELHRLRTEPDAAFVAADEEFPMTDGFTPAMAGLAEQLTQAAVRLEQAIGALRAVTGETLLTTALTAERVELSRLAAGVRVVHDAEMTAAVAAGGR